MFPKTYREVLQLSFWLSWTVLLMNYASGAWQDHPVVTTLVVLVAIASTLILLSMLARGDDGIPVDIWAPQRTLMAASKQRLPLSPIITNDTALYVYLILEETSEFAGHLYEILANRWAPKMTQERSAVLSMLSNLALALSQSAERGRDELAVAERIHLPLAMHEARTLLDDSVDIAVVTAGLGLATGLPAREAYAAVAKSNLSKRNPDTGVIDKHPDGKWIKGRNYKAPDLDQHLWGFYGGIEG